MCDCAYCRLPVHWLTDKYVCLPAYIRLTYNQRNIVGVLDANHKVHFADGAVGANLTQATTHAFAWLFGKSVPRELRYVRPEQLWTIRIAKLGSVPIASIASTQWGSCTGQLPPSTPCVDDSPIVDTSNIDSQASQFSLLFGLQRKRTSDAAPSSKRQKVDDSSSSKAKGDKRGQRKRKSEMDETIADEDVPISVEDDGDEMVPSVSTWSITAPLEEWTDRNIHDFLVDYPDKAPLLESIDYVVRPSAYGNPFVMCNLRHPHTNELKRVRLSSSVVGTVPQYKPMLERALIAGTS